MNWAALLTGIAWGLAIIVMLPLAVFSLEVLFGLPRPRASAGGESAPVASSAVLIPAHNEAAGLAATLQALGAVAPANLRVVVVADNCSDATAAIARDMGAEVVERFDPSARGKGFALACGRDYLAGQSPPPQVVIVLDADCRLLPGSIEALATAAVRHAAPVQAVNLISADLGAPPLVQISSFAMVVKNLFRSRGMQRLGGAALLTGTGMAFPWALFAEAQLATGSIVEDLALGIGFTRAGTSPRLIETAGVRSAPAALADAMVQRRRWEHGFLATLRQSAIPVLGAGFRERSLALILLGFHLLVPPLALLLLAAGAVLGLVAILWLAGASPLPGLALLTTVSLVLALVICAWIAGGREYLSGRALLRAPLYVLWKVPIYLGFVRKPEAEWQRSPRAGD